MTSTGGAEPGRRYAGLDADARRAARRAALLAAGLDLFGTLGYPNVSVKQVCDRARLTQRYFYESFADREALLVAVYDGVVDDVRTRTLEAVAATAADDGVGDVAAAGLGAFVDCLTGDERLARVMLLEVVGVSPALEERRYAVIHAFAELIQVLAVGRFGLPEQDGERPGLASVALVGAANQLLVDWTIGAGPRPRPDQVRDVLVDLFEATFERLAR